MIPATVLHEAEVELWEAVHYYETRCPGLGVDFLREVEAGLITVRISPDLWPVREDGTRRYLLQRFPYVVVYLHVEDHVWIIAVAHCKRRSGYWRDRIRKAQSGPEDEP